MSRYMISFERFVAGGKERADEMAKGAGSMRKWLRSVQQRKEAVCAALHLRPCQRGATTPSFPNTVQTNKHKIAVPK